MNFKLVFLMTEAEEKTASKTDRQMLHVVSGSLVLIGSAWEDFFRQLPFPTD